MSDKRFRPQPVTRCASTSVLPTKTDLSRYPSSRQAPILVPSFCLHRFLNCRPDSLDDFPISPPARRGLMSVPLVNLRARHAATPPSNSSRHIFPSPANIDAKRMSEQVRRRLPLVRLELPTLACCEDCCQSGPVVWLELLRCVDDDETERSLRID